MQDPWVQGMGWKKGKIAPQKCYLDHIEAWCVNECTINWNASLAWVAGFLAQENGGITVGETGRSAGISNDGGKGESNGKPTYEDDSQKKDEAKSEVTTKAETKKKSAGDTDAKSGSSGVLTAVIIIVGIVAFAGVILGIALMIFIYKMVKLKSEKGSGQDDKKSS
jgi:endoglucanase